MDCSPPGSSVHGIFQARILEWVAISSSRGSSRSKDQTRTSYISCLGRQILSSKCSLIILTAFFPPLSLVPSEWFTAVYSRLAAAVHKPYPAGHRDQDGNPRDQTESDCTRAAASGAPVELLLLLLLLLSRSVVSDSMWPHRRQPTRLPCPWDSPGKNTGVGCHFLLQCMKVKSESELAQSCQTLCDRMDCSLPGSSAHGIFQARVLEWGAIAFSNSATQKDKTYCALGKWWLHANIIPNTGIFHKSTWVYLLKCFIY